MYICYMQLHCHTWLYAGASTPYKWWSKCPMEKVRGKIFAAFSRNLGGDKFINCSITFVCKLSSFILELANIKMFNLQRKLTHFPPKFLQNPPPPNLIMYWQNIVSYSTVKIIHCTVVRSNFEKNLPYNWLYQSITISRQYSSPERLRETQRSQIGL